MQIPLTRQRPDELRRGVRLEYFTVAWNLAEAVVGFAAGLAVGSSALVGFALDSVVESTSGGVLIWRLKAETRGASIEAVEQRAVRILAICFGALAAYVAWDSVSALASHAEPDESPVGIALAATSLAVMPFLAWRKRKTARALDSRALQADSRQTSLCTYMSAILLAGLVANATLGWWWADPVAGLGIAAFAAREGRELWSAKDFCCR